MQHRYIDLDIEDALKKKWIAGAKEHRKPGQIGFQGDAAAELFEECLDAINLVDVLESRGVELPGFKTTFRNMAFTLQARERELRRRI
jgi:hypothetical protein